MVQVFGRESELALADAFLGVAKKRFGVLRLDGEAGIGKTTVWREIARRAEASGFRILSSRPAQTETKLALSAVSDLLVAVSDRELATLPEPQRWALEVALLRADPGSDTPDQRTLGTAVRSLLAHLSEEQPLMVAIDDVQWLDRTSVMVLEFALRRLSDARIGWLLARRLPEAERLDIDALVPPESITGIALGPLSLAAVHHLLGDRLERALPRSVLIRVQETCGGNPFYALEVGRELLRSNELPAPGVSLPVPDDVRRLVSRRLRRLPADTRAALFSASALANPTTSLVESEALAAAEKQGIVQIDERDRIAFAHPLYASAIYESGSRVEQRELHRRLAARVGDLEQRARHLALASAGPDEDVARQLDQAADRARSRGAWGAAAELLEQARGLTPPAAVAELRRRWIAAAESHVHAGDRSRARTLLEEIVAEPMPRRQAAEALFLLAEVTYNDGSSVEAKRLYGRALESADDPSLALRIEFGLGYVSSNLMDLAGGRVHARRALERAERIDDAGFLAVALSHCAMFDYLCGDGVDWEIVERSLALEDPQMVLPLQTRPSLIAACLHLYAGNLSEARARLTDVWTQAAGGGDESDLAFVALWLSWLETRAGYLAGAATLADEAAALASLTGSESNHAWALAQRAWVLAHRGDAEQTRRTCAEAAELVARSATVPPRTWIPASLGLLELSLGDPEAAWRACETMTEAIEERGVGEPVIPFFLPEALEALIALGHLDRAERLLADLEGRALELDRAWAIGVAARCRGLLLAARGDLDGAGSALDEAIAGLDWREMPFELARAELVKGVVERRRRRRARARESFERALAGFEAMGAALWSERTRRELSRLGLRRSGDGELTTAERRVAELAARGLTNREVAATLFVSPKTVEANLSRCYRKLGIRSRAELGGVMAPEK